MCRGWILVFLHSPFHIEVIHSSLADHAVDTTDKPSRIAIKAVRKVSHACADLEIPWHASRSDCRIRDHRPGQCIAGISLTLSQCSQSAAEHETVSPDRR